MERGFDQLFIVAAFLLAALIDLFVRWLKRKSRTAPRPQVDEGLVLKEEAETELLERGPIEPRPQLPPVALPSAAPPPRPPRPPGPAVRLRRKRDRRWLRNATDARRGIVLMAVLGPCRGLEAPAKDV